MKNLIRYCVLLLALAILTLAPRVYAQSSITQIIKENKAPRLVVLLVVDQGRADYITRYKEWFVASKMKSGEPGGFRFFIDNGAFFLNAHWKHLPTGTGPGHAVLTTGSMPFATGIVSNTWYDRVNKKPLYCAEDTAYTAVGADAALRGSSAIHCSCSLMRLKPFRFKISISCFNSTIGGIGSRHKCDPIGNIVSNCLVSIKTSYKN